MKIEKPDRSDWGELSWSFNHWFKEKVEPVNEMLAKGVEVYGANRGEVIYGKEGYFAKDDIKTKALLINIEPIKKETADSLLKEIVRDFDLDFNPEKWNTRTANYIKRAKAVLGEKWP